MNSFKKGSYGEMILGALFVIYILVGHDTPPLFGVLINSVFGKIFMLLIIISLFLHANPIVAALALFVAFELMRRSGNYHNDDLHAESNNFKPIPEYPVTRHESQSQDFTEFNQFPYTLEQEVVKNMVPLNNSGNNNKPASYKPILEDHFDATPINQSD